MTSPRRLTLTAALAILLACSSPAPQAHAEPLPPPVSMSGLPEDVGIFPDLNPKVTLRWPAWLPAPAVALLPAGTPWRWGLAAGVPLLPTPTSTRHDLPLASWEGYDADGDGIPDPVDLLIGAKRAAANGARYDATYKTLTYPGGDVPRDMGVCTDVIIRAMRNAGFDLQQLLHEDIKRRPRAYPMVKRASTHIDHRRVRTLLPWFEHYMDARPVDPKTTLHDWLPGDIVLMDTLPRSGPDHIGIVSDTLGPSGLPLIINNWTDGYTTQPMDLLAFVPITHRFRLRRPDAFSVPPEHRAVPGVLRRAGLAPLDPATRQLILVTASAWEASTGTLRRYARGGADQPWRPDGAPVSVGLGTAGLGWGLGLVPASARPGEPTKAEGDRRSPAGLFSLGAAFGARRSPRSRWPFRPAGPQDVFVDDPASTHYNTWQILPATPPPWTSAERLAIYRLGVIIEHNTHPRPVPGAGSAIFLHGDDLGATTLGCTALPEPALRDLIAWLDPDAQPRLLQLVAQTL